MLAEMRTLSPLPSTSEAPFRHFIAPHSLSIYIIIKLIIFVSGGERVYVGGEESVMKRHVTIY